MRASTSSAFSWVCLPRETALSRIFCEYALPLSAFSCATSLRTTSRPDIAHEYAMPAPIIPAPSTTTLRALCFS